MITYMINFENLHLVNRQFKDQFHAALDVTLESGQFILGDVCIRFETAWAGYCGQKHCVSVNSGTDALQLILEAYRFDAKRKVILSANSYIATILAVVNAGLCPVFVDIDMSYNIDTSRLDSVDKTGVVAIMPTHMYGRPSDMIKIREWAGDDIKVIADCCQAHGATIDGVSVASYADANAFSFYPTKNLGCLGDGGAVVTNDECLADQIRMMRFYGVLSKASDKSIGGGNSRLDAFQSEVLLIKMRELDTMLEHKLSLASQYCDRLGIKYVIGHSYHIFAVRVADRLEFRLTLLNANIETDIHYPVPGYKQLSFNGSYPVADGVAENIVSLPISYNHTLDDIETVCDAIADLGSCIM